ncbi:MAG: hypothetical protein KAJ79_04455, partial [Candidatus Omnitrophica bacterium]|nr:hypothetical protein [Candidatus Omnitrophota bacterium]
EVKKNIKLYLNELADIKLKTNGKDLKRLGFKPLTAYSKIFKKLLYMKIDKRFKTKEEELNYAQRILYRLSKESNP